jgi:hypothetical protein
MKRDKLLTTAAVTLGLGLSLAVPSEASDGCLNYQVESCQAGPGWCCSWNEGCMGIGMGQVTYTGQAQCMYYS